MANFVHVKQKFTRNDGQSITFYLVQAKAAKEMESLTQRILMRRGLPLNQGELSNFPLMFEYKMWVNDNKINMTDAEIKADATLMLQEEYNVAHSFASLLHVFDHEDNQYIFNDPEPVKPFTEEELEGITVNYASRKRMGEYVPSSGKLFDLNALILKGDVLHVRYKRIHDWLMHDEDGKVYAQVMQFMLNYDSALITQMVETDRNGFRP